MKFPVEQCECGLDLTTAKPVRVRLGMGPNDEPVGGCPNCWRTYVMVEEKPEPGPEASAEPEAEAPETEPEAEPEPPAEAEPEPEPAAEAEPEVEPSEE